MGSKVMSLTGTKTSPMTSGVKQPALPMSKTTPVSSSKPTSSSMITSGSLSSVAAKLSNSGVTLSKPTSSGDKSSSVRNTPSPVVVGKPVSSSQTQGTKMTKDNSQQMSKKFPYLNISQVPEGSTSTTKISSGSGSPKPLLSVKPSSQLLKPGAMTNLSATAANKPAGSPTAAGAAAKLATKMANTDARNKLAMFKAQMKKQLNIPQGGSKAKSSTVSSPSGPSRPASGSAASLTSARPAAASSASSASRPSSSSATARPGMVKLTAGSAANKNMK